MTSLHHKRLAISVLSIPRISLSGRGRLDRPSTNEAKAAHERVRREFNVIWTPGALGCPAA